MQLDVDDLPDAKLFLAGQWREGSGAEITSVFPHDGSHNRTIRGASLSDGNEAIEKAVKAQADPAWRNLRPHERSRYLYRIADGIEANAERISFIQSRDTGKTLRETAALAASAAGTFRYFGAVAETMDDELTAQRGSSLTMSVHEPLGVVSAITPWNSPIASDAQKVAPALAAGNAVLLKPASWSPLTALELARIVQQSGLPEGLFSVLPGKGSEIGNLLVEHPDIAKVSFTGGTTTGRGLALKAAQKLMPVSLELGGKSPTIVFEDADMAQAIAGVLFGIFSSTGQSCIAGSRLFVQSSIHEQFVDRLVSATRRLRLGHPFEPSTQVAPLVHMDHRDVVAAHVATALEDGATLLCGGAAPQGPEYSSGSYYLPTILSGMDNTDRISREEVFGPVLAVMTFDDEAEIIEKANDNEYGLACGIWTSDFPKAWRVGRAIRSGTIWHNTYKQFSISTPFGGEGNSGVGREKGRRGLRAYMTQKSFYSDLAGEPLPWALPAMEYPL